MNEWTDPRFCFQDFPNAIVELKCIKVGGIMNSQEAWEMMLEEASFLVPEAELKF